MESAERTSGAVWPLTWLSSAVAIAIAAFLAARGTEATRNVCHLAAYADRLDSAGLKIPYRPPSCTAADVQYSVWLYVAIAGLAITLIAALVLLRRAGRAASSGRPWPTRRVTQAIATSIDRRLPGLRAGPRGVTAISLVVLAGALGAGALAFSSYRGDQDHTNFEQTASELGAVRKLPTGLRPSNPPGCQGALCALSTVAPARAAAIVAGFLKTTVEPGLAAARCASPSACRIYVGGEFDGFPTIAALVPVPGPRSTVAEVYFNPTLPSRYS